MSDDFSSSESKADDNASDYKSGHTVEKIKHKFITPLSLLNLCANLADYSCSKRIQMLINTFLKQITKANHIIIMPLLTTSEEALIQVINDKILDPEIRFAIKLDDMRNASFKGFRFSINDMNRDFRDFVEALIGTGANMLYFDTTELNKNTRSTLPAMVPPNENSSEPKPTISTDCSIVLNGDMKLPPIINDGELRISFFVCISGDESLRAYYRYCIYETLRFTIGHLLTAIELDEMRRIREKCHKLLKVARNLLGHIRDFTDLLQYIISPAKEIIGAESCFLYLCDKSTGELVTYEGPDNLNKKMRIEQSSGIAGHVIETGKLLNVRNVYNHPKFDTKIDDPANCNIRNILSFPIFDRESVIGVVHLYNKINDYYFDKIDEEITKTFSIYIGFHIINLLAKHLVKMTELRTKILQDLTIYHMKISEDEVNELIESIELLTKKRIPNLSAFTFRTRTLSRFQTFKASLQMFHDLNFFNKFNIRREKIARFFIVLEKTYRDLPYHNWMHAFTVAHFAYALLMNCKLVEKGILNELEALAFLISTFCHDIDHRGTSNSYHLTTKSNIAQLYDMEGSINERHHLSQTIYILHDENIKILDGLTTEQFKNFIETTREFILATDLAHHFKILKAMAETYTHTNEENKHMTMSLLMTCSDLSDQIKEWPTPQQVSVHIYNEFFVQGDLEKQIGLTPELYMDRKRAVIPQLQTNFIIDVARPAFQILGKVLPETNHLLDIINDNLEHWQMLLQPKE